jgi:outer membrane protein TolC
VRVAKPASLITIFLLLGSAIFALDLAEMLQAAVENDIRMKVLRTTLDNTLLAIQRARLAPGRNLDISTGDIQATYSASPREDESRWLLSFSPSAALVLGRKKETQISAELPMAVGLDTGYFGGLPRVAIRQPLDKLFGGAKFTEAEELENRYAVEKARVDILNRVKELEQDLLQQLAKLTVLQGQSAELKRTLAAAMSARQQAETLQTYTEGSAQQRQLEFAVHQAQRQAELQQKRIDQAWKALERMVGKPLQELPSGYPDVTLQLPGSAAMARNPEVFLSSLSVDVERARLKEEKGPSKPKYFLGSALRSDLDRFTNEKSTSLAGTVEGELQDFKFSAGVGGIAETRSIFVTFGLSWSFPDKEIRGLNVKEKENLLDMSRSNLTGARQTFLQTAELLALEVAELGDRQTNLDEESTLAALELEEGLKRHQAGLITDQELDDLRWQVDKLDYDARTLQLDRLLAASRIDALTALETETH